MDNKKLRIAVFVSLGINLLLFSLLWILEARVSKLESKHTNSTPLVIKLKPE